MTPTLGQRWLSGPERIEVLTCPESEHAARTPLLFVHGGSLVGGDKADTDYGRVCEPFAAAGVGCANINYRLLST